MLTETDARLAGRRAFIGTAARASCDRGSASPNAFAAQVRFPHVDGRCALREDWNGALPPLSSLIGLTRSLRNPSPVAASPKPPPCIASTRRQRPILAFPLLFRLAGTPFARTSTTASVDRPTTSARRTRQSSISWSCLLVLGCREMRRRARRAGWMTLDSLGRFAMFTRSLGGEGC